MDKDNSTPRKKPPNKKVAKKPVQSRTAKNNGSRQSTAQKAKPVNNRPNPNKNSVKINGDVRKPVKQNKPIKQTKPVKPKNTSTRIMIGVFVVLLIYGLGMFFRLLTNSKVDSITLKSVDVSKNDTYSAIVIRDEQLYTSENEGYLKLSARELDKVKKGELLFYVTTELDEQLQSELSQVSEEIFNLQTFREEFSNYKKDIDIVQENIEKSIDSFSYKSYSDITELNNQITSNINVRNQMIFADQRIVDSSKVDTKGILEDKIDANSFKTYSINGGIVSYSYDDLEEVITPENMTELTKEQTKMDSSPTEHGDIVSVPGDKILRVVESNTWYLATYLPAKDANNFTVLQDKTLFFDINGSFKEIPARVKFVSETTEKEVFVIFELRSYMEDFINERNINFALKTLSYMNIKVPKTAITYKEFIKIPKNFVSETTSKVVIKRQDNGEPLVIPIVIDSFDEVNEIYYLDKAKNTILIGDTLEDPLNAENIYLVPDFIKTPGVFKINNGTANFEKIEINSEIVQNEEDDFVYILPSTSLKEYDRILTHAENTNEGEIIY